MKRVLLFYKKSTFKHDFLNHKRLEKYHSVAPKHAKRFKQTHIQHYETVMRVEAFLKDSGILYKKVYRGRKIDFSKYDFIITVGGDGTFLEAARSVKGQLILGINSDPKWSVGRFCRANSITYPGILARILKSQCRIQLINRMRMRLKSQSISTRVLNDILICHKNPAAMSRYSISIRGVKDEQRSSGIWIATAAGSTGAIQSAGGKVLGLTSKKLQYKVRELYCGWGTKHRLQQGFLKPTEPVRITSLMKDGMIYIDGSHEKFPFPFGEELIVSTSSKPLRMALVKNKGGRL